LYNSVLIKLDRQRWDE